MEMVEVKSSNIKSIGYLPEAHLLRIQFRDGSTYNWLNVSPERHARLMAAESKGAHLRQYFPGGVRDLADGGEIKVKKPFVVGEVPSEQTIMRTFADDECCGARIIAAAREGKLNDSCWLCPRCGQTWKPSMITNVQHWAPEEFAQVWR